ncbi:hypothetical protein MIND_00827600 [Mycena indigotica]|uniref:F-box domain-containing protein n=1 Tax=Mycena indigotica TaxID=2126181 RepID=A0A8H6SHB8_9AGAR|nr:uncharacterized protein MIND_00827600 [Mycena indigotica]KAF7298800.1 hypothetical protein MIND_00827600 [Mycena indigotica]
MVHIPPELINLIVAEIPSRSSLERCSLVASPFRQPCQQRLHRLLKVTTKTSGRGGRYMHWKDIAKHFRASPHLVSYVVQLMVEFEAEREVFSDTMKEVLGQLTSVREVCLIGTMSSFTKPFHSGGAPIILSWLSSRPRGATRRLVVEAFPNIPVSDMHLIYNAAPTLYLRTVGPPSHSQDTPSEAPTTPNSIVNFRAPKYPTSITTLLLPEFEGYIKGLKHISIEVDPKVYVLQAFYALLCLTKATIESIAYNEYMPDDWTEYEPTLEVKIGLPGPLPKLTHLLVRVEKDYKKGYFEPKWLIPLVLATIFPASKSPALTCVTVQVFLDLSRSKHCPGPLPTELMKTLDDTFTQHCNVTAVKWVICDPENAKKKDCEAIFQAFREALPKIVAKGLLTTEREILRKDPLLESRC